MDWKNLISEIQETGMSQAAIGLVINRSQVWVADALKGRYNDLKWTDGQALIALHKERCGSKKAA